MSGAKTDVGPARARPLHAAPGEALAWIESGRPADVALLGGKGAGLAGLASAGVRVPPAFVLTATAYRAAVPQSVRRDVARLVASMPPDAHGERLEREARKIRDRVLDATRAHLLRAQLEDAYRELSARAGTDEAHVAVRSSAITEDGCEWSSAGGHDTYLWVAGVDALDARVRDCWASLFTARAIAYGRRSAARGEPAMAVVVQQMVPARSAGVFVTLNPTNGDRSKVVVETIWGVGTPLVSGELTPDRFVVDKVTGQVVARDITLKPVEAVPTGRSGNDVVMRDVPHDRRARSSLEADELAEVVRLARAVEEWSRIPQDGEFAIARGALDHGVYVLQARPETVWSRGPRQAISGGRRSAVGAVLATLTRRG